MNIAVIGDGKMGELLVKRAKDKGISVLGVVGQKTNSLPTLDKLKSLPNCIVDFSAPILTKLAIDFCYQNKVPLVVGTTGLDEQILQRIKDLSSLVPVAYSSNFSMGVALLKRLLTVALNSLLDFDIELTEKHHAQKKDAPSGTAKELMAIIKAFDKSKIFVYGRQNEQQRQNSQVGVFSLRGGSVVGEHIVEFFGKGEEIALLHKATDRQIFADGALKVAQKIYKMDSGLYRIEDFFCEKNNENN